MTTRSAGHIAPGVDSCTAATRDACPALWDWLPGAMLVPGEFLASRLRAAAPAVAERFGLPPEAGDAEVLGLSILAWCAALFVAWIAWRLMLGMLRAAWNGTVTAVERLARRVRIARNRAQSLLARVGEWRRALQSAYPEEIAIGDLELAILQVQAVLPPGYTVTAVDLAAELGVRPLEAQEALDELRKLELVEISFSTSDGYAGYLLTRTGQLFTRTGPVRTAPAA